MKRRIKLLTSIASLAIAMSLLALGVYAAAARNITISGTVSFEISNVASIVKVSQSAMLSSATTPSFTQIGADIKFNINDTTQPDAGRELGAKVFTEALTHYYVQVEIKNDFTSGGRSIEVVAPIATNPAAHLIVTSQQSTNDGASFTTISNGTTTLSAQSIIIYRYTYALDANKSANIAAGTAINLPFTLRAV